MVPSSTRNWIAINAVQRSSPNKKIKTVHGIGGPRDPKKEAAAVELAKVLAALKAEVEHRRLLEALLLTAVEHERKRLGRDLHDDLSQRLAAIAIMMKTFTTEIKDRSKADSGRKRAILIRS